MLEVLCIPGIKKLVRGEKVAPVVQWCPHTLLLDIFVPAS